MLTHLSIRGLAVIEHLEIEFSSGFNVITGETGAGKSILIKALQLLLGGKAAAETVRSGCEEALICGEFAIGGKDLLRGRLIELGLLAEDKAEDEMGLLIRRRVGKTGRSQAWINDTPITIASLKDLSQDLIDIFGQHENHRLLQPQSHIDYLDCFLAHGRFKEGLESGVKSLNAQFRELRGVVEQYHSRLRDRDYLEFRLKELAELDPSEADYVQLLETSQKAAKAMQLEEALSGVQASLDTGCEGEPLSRGLWQIHRVLDELPMTEELAKKAADIATSIDDLSYEVVKLLSGEGSDSAGLEAAQNRLARYQDFFRKLNVADASELGKEYERLSNEISFVDQAEIALTERLEKMLATARDVSSLAERLGKQRKKAAKTIKSSVEKELGELAMPGASFDVEFSAVERTVESLELAGFSEDLQGMFAEIAEVYCGVNESGAERAQFLLSANPGERAHHLQKVASGGEVSRIMLALKRALSSGADSCLLVFDEIDTGISGKVADIVGSKLKALGKKFQVLCISHLPQVAAYAEHHFKTEKSKNKGRVESRIKQLDEKERLEELARLLSGTEVTKQSMANAKTLVDRASV